MLPQTTFPVPQPLGVTEDEAAASDFEAKGGILSSAFEASAEYRLTDVWDLAGKVRYDRFMNDTVSG